MRYKFSGLGGSTQSCQTCATINLYSGTTEGGFPLSTLDTSVQEAKQSGAITSEGAVGDFSSLSQTFAQNLNRSTYYEYVYPPPEREMKTVSSETEFEKSNDPAGIVELYNKKLRTTHFTTISKTEDGSQTLDSLDPNRPQAEDYSVIEIRPLQELPLP